MSLKYVSAREQRRTALSDGLKNLHVQSFFYATDEAGLELIEPALRCYDTRGDAIRRGELGLAKGVLAAGYNVAVTDKYWYRHDFRVANAAATKRMCHAASRHTKSWCGNGDTHCADSYMGLNHNPFESLFVKSNRMDGRWKKARVPSIHTKHD